MNSCKYTFCAFFLFIFVGILSYIWGLYNAMLPVGVTYIFKLFWLIGYIGIFLSCLKFIKIDFKSKDKDTNIVFALFPILVFSIYNCLHVYAANFDVINSYSVFYTCIFLCSINVFIYFCTKLLFKNNEKSAIFTCWLIFLFFQINQFVIWLDNAFIICCFILPILLLMKMNTKGLFRFLVFLSSLLLFFNLVDISFAFCKSQTKKQVVMKQFNIEENKNLPNIYIVILDAYPNNSVLKRDFAFSNESFIKELQTRGFYVYDKMYSNYVMTSLSIPSILNLDYQEKFKFDTLSEAIYYSHFFGLAKSIGYKITYINDNYWENFKLRENTYIDKLYSVNYLGFDSAFADEILGDTLYNIKFKFTDRIHFDNDKHSWRYLVNSLEKSPNSNQFVFAHICAPHAPYWRDIDGNLLTQNKDYSDNNLTITNKEAVVKYIQYTNKNVNEIIDKILEHDKSAYILITGDHGIRLNHDGATNNLEKKYYNPQKNILNSYFNTFTAIYIPKKDYSKYKIAESLVNLFIIFSNDIFSTNYKLKPDKFFFSLDTSNTNNLEMYRSAFEY